MERSQDSNTRQSRNKGGEKLKRRRRILLGALLAAALLVTVSVAAFAADSNQSMDAAAGIQFIKDPQQEKPPEPTDPTKPDPTDPTSTKPDPTKPDPARPNPSKPDKPDSGSGSSVRDKDPGRSSTIPDNPVTRSAYPRDSNGSPLQQPNKPPGETVSIYDLQTPTSKLGNLPKTGGNTLPALALLLLATLFLYGGWRLDPTHPSDTHRVPAE